MHRYRHYSRTRSFITLDELQIVLQDFAFLVVEIETGIGQFLPLLATALVASGIAYFLLARGAARILDTASEPLGVRSVISAATSIALIAGAWMQVSDIQPGRFIGAEPFGQEWTC